MTDEPTPSGPPELAEAKALMADKTLGYADRAHPRHTETNGRVKELFRKMTPAEVATPAPPPKPTADPVAEWRKAVDATPPDVAPPSMPEALRKIVPKTPKDYEILTPGTRAEGPKWDDARLQQFLDQAAFPARLNNGQASDLLNLEATFIQSVIRERGADALADPVIIGKLKVWADQRGMSRGQFERLLTWRLDRLEAENLDRIRRGLPVLGERPPVAQRPEAAEVQSLLHDRQGPYWNSAGHLPAKVNEARAKVSAYFEKKTVSEGSGKTTPGPGAAPLPSSESSADRVNSHPIIASWGKARP